jgi:uncharacterized protein DUF2304
MTAAGVLLVDALALALLFWVLNLVRWGRLYVGYGALFVAVLLFSAAAVSVPPLTRLLGTGLAFFFPAGGVAVLGLSFVLLLLIYILTQMTILSNRLSALVQELALSHKEQAPPTAPKAPSQAGDPPDGPA